MEKIYICPGVFMINIREADLRILCGCPMDIVKVLKRKGIICPIEREHTIFETGPNAILLSDIVSQNNQLCNLMEFPILHMQFRQGMLIPGHPNNKGIRPLIIGQKDQINAQCNYFIRGKYGLISVQELIKAGLEQQEAIDLMRLKMRFNFGRLEKIEEQLDLCYVEGIEKKELRADVYISRISHNIYEFYYGDETAQVNLNLLPYEKYASSYNLDYHKPIPGYFSVTHLGEGDGWDTERAGMSSLICYQNRYFLVDAPAGVEQLLHAAGLSINELEGIFHSHCHDDHFSGLTALIRSDHRIKYFATKAVRHSVQKKLSALLSVDEEMFFRFFDCFDMEFDQWNPIEGLEVKPLWSPHPVETSIFYFRTLWKDKYFYYGHLADTCSDRILRSFITEDPKAYGLSQEYYDQVKEMYLMPADLKKIDIGGGMIHGDAIDFCNDTSDKILLCHIDRPLTDVEKEIGTNASFAQTDVLIPSKIDFYIECAKKWLKGFAPRTPEYGLNTIINGTYIHLNTGTIIIKRGETVPNLYLLLHGVVEAINPETNVSLHLYSGSMIGGKTLLLGDASNLTIRAESSVTLLEIPINICITTQKDSGVAPEELIRIQAGVDSVESWDLFAEGLGYVTLRSILANIQIYEIESGELVHGNELPGVYMLAQGFVGVFEEGEVQYLFTPGDIFGEETIIPNLDNQRVYEAIGGTIIYHIPAEVINLIPVIQWRLMELYNNRVAQLLSTCQIIETSEAFPHDDIPLE